MSFRALVLVGVIALVTAFSAFTLTTGLTQRQLVRPRGGAFLCGFDAAQAAFFGHSPCEPQPASVWRVAALGLDLSTMHTFSANRSFSNGAAAVATKTVTGWLNALDRPRGFDIDAPNKDQCGLFDVFARNCNDDQREIFDAATDQRAVPPQFLPVLLASPLHGPRVFVANGPCVLNPTTNCVCSSNFAAAGACDATSTSDGTYGDSESCAGIYLGAALTNGTHGLGFRYKSGLLGLVLAVVISGTAAVCGTVMLVRLLFTTAAGTAGFVLTHIGELLWRRSVARHEEKLETVDRERRRLEERNEQLRAEKERLLYDNALQRRSRPSMTFEDDERSVIRRGLSAQPYHPAGDAYPASESSRTTSSASDKAGPRHPSGSPPASLPPGPPSSVASKSSSSSGSGGAPAAAGSASVTSSVNEHEHTDVAVLGDRHLLELEVERWTDTSSLTSSQGALLADLASGLVTQPSSSAPEQSAGQAMAASDRAMVIQDTVNVNSTLSQVGPSCWPVGPSCSNVYSNAHGPPAAVSLGSQSSTIASTPEQRALQAARDGMRAARGDIQRFYVLRTLATALGASRTETGTISALHAVLLQLDQPSLSCEEACEFTGASMSNFKKWRRRVHQARLNLPSEYRVNSEARHRIQ